MWTFKIRCISSIELGEDIPVFSCQKIQGQYKIGVLIWSRHALAEAALFCFCIRPYDLWTVDGRSGFLSATQTYHQRRHHKVTTRPLNPGKMLRSKRVDQYMMCKWYSSFLLLLRTNGRTW
jgi:hypothetical protein